MDDEIKTLQVIRGVLIQQLKREPTPEEILDKIRQMKVEINPALILDHIEPWTDVQMDKGSL